MRYFVAIQLFISSFFIVSFADAAAKEYVVGIENIDYYPHYDFASAEPRGYFYELMTLFSKHSGHTFKYRNMPIKRLYVAANDGLDLIYPDNPRWQPYLPVAYTKTYSEPVIYSLGSTMVLPELRHISVARVKNLAVIHGFTPSRWLELKTAHTFRIVDVPDASSALGLLLKKRVDAAVVEYNVAQYYLKQHNKSGGLVFAEELPFTEMPFLLSSVTHPELIAEFNQFLITEKQAIKALKQKFQLIEHKSELQPSLKGNP